MERFMLSRSRQSGMFLIGILAFFIGLALGATFIPALQGAPTWVWISRFVQNGIAAVAGALITLLVVERVLLRRVVSEAESISEQLIAELRGEDDDATKAADVLAVTGQFRDGSLCGANLTGAHLAGRNLSRADLSEARLRAANLRDSDLRKADLHNADLSLADLRRANLREANLRGAKLWMAYLHGANLRKAQVSEAALDEAFSLRGALMPDGSRYDGRFALPGDLEAAGEEGINVTDRDAMTQWYAGVSAEERVEQ